MNIMTEGTSESTIMSQTLSNGTCLWCGSLRYPPQRIYCSLACKNKGCAEARAQRRVAYRASLPASALPPCPRCTHPIQNQPGPQGQGRPKRVCSDACAKRASADRQRQRRAAVQGARPERLDRLVGGAGPAQAQPLPWWLAQALQLDGGECPKCSGVTQGGYVPPTTATLNECAVVEHCQLCGWEHPVLCGAAGGPFTDPLPPRGIRAPIGRAKERLEEIDND